MSKSAEQGTFYFENPTFFDMEEWREETVDMANIILDKLGGDRRDEDGDEFREYFWSSEDLKFRYELRRSTDGDTMSYQLIIYDWAEDDGEGKTNYYFSDEEGTSLYVEGEDRTAANSLGNPVESGKFLCMQLSSYLESVSGYDGRKVQNWPLSKLNRVFSDMMACMLSEDELIIQEVHSRRKLSARRRGYYETVSEVKKKYQTQDDELLRRAFDLAEQRAS